MSHNNFNCAFELYTKLPTQEIMRDYDRLINNLPHRPFEFLTDAENCAMKVAGCYDVLSDEKRRLLRGFGNHAELSYGLNGRPPILTVQPRLEIRDELIAARPRIIAILNERRF
jgi:hypothetical protein